MQRQPPQDGQGSLSLSSTRVNGTGKKKEAGEQRCLPPELVLVCSLLSHLPELGLDDNLALVSWHDGFADTDLPPVNDRLARATVPLPTPSGGRRGAKRSERARRSLENKSTTEGARCLGMSILGGGAISYFFAAYCERDRNGGRWEKLVCWKR